MGEEGAGEAAAGTAGLGAGAGSGIGAGVGDGAGGGAAIGAGRASGGTGVARIERIAPSASLSDAWSLASCSLRFLISATRNACCASIALMSPARRAISCACASCAVFMSAIVTLAGGASWGV